MNTSQPLPQPEQHTTELEKLSRVIDAILAEEHSECSIHCTHIREQSEDRQWLVQALAVASQQWSDALINHKVVSELEKSLDEHARTCGARRVGDPRDWCRFQEVVEAQIEALKEQGDTE